MVTLLLFVLLSILNMSYQKNKKWLTQLFFHSLHGPVLACLVGLHSLSWAFVGPSWPMLAFSGL
jgi:hypothetical protein